jgi:hypothetical protein
MTHDTAFYVSNMGEFESRGEVRFYKWCIERGIPIQSKPPRIYGFGDRSYPPDFLLPSFDPPIIVEVKPLEFAFENAWKKDILIAAIRRGERFWTWFLDNEWKKPRIYQWSRFRPESEEPIEQQMQTFLIRDHPNDLTFLDNDSQLLLF